MIGGLPDPRRRAARRNPRGDAGARIRTTPHSRKPHVPEYSCELRRGRSVMPYAECARNLRASEDLAVSDSGMAESGQAPPMKTPITLMAGHAIV
ncbi:hypothetical protein GCM10010299_60160 [Streptomyces tanashiensis]|nr:hypothetical protein GCM10010299_60160 [Streptomyces tanashiensis]